MKRKLLVLEAAYNVTRHITPVSSRSLVSLFLEQTERLAAGVAVSSDEKVDPFKEQEFPVPVHAGVAMDVEQLEDGGMTTTSAALAGAARTTPGPHAPDEATEVAGGLVPVPMEPGGFVEAPTPATRGGKHTRAAHPDPALDFSEESLDTKLHVKAFLSSTAEDMIRRGDDKFQIDAILEQLRAVNAELSEHAWRCPEAGCPTPGGNMNPCSLPICVACGSAWAVHGGTRARQRQPSEASAELAPAPC